MELLPMMIDWETGEISEEDEIILFQELVNTGMAWNLQGAYGRNAEWLLKNGHIVRG